MRKEGPLRGWKIRGSIYRENPPVKFCKLTSLTQGKTISNTFLALYRKAVFPSFRYSCNFPSFPYSPNQPPIICASIYPSRLVVFRETFFLLTTYLSNYTYYMLLSSPEKWLGIYILRTKAVIVKRKKSAKQIEAGLFLVGLFAFHFSLQSGVISLDKSLVCSFL